MHSFHYKKIYEKTIVFKAEKFFMCKITMVPTTDAFIITSCAHLSFFIHFKIVFYLTDIRLKWHKNWNNCSVTRLFWPFAKHVKNVTCLSNIRAFRCSSNIFITHIYKDFSWTKRFNNWFHAVFHWNSFVDKMVSVHLISFSVLSFIKCCGRY